MKNGNIEIGIGFVRFKADEELSILDANDISIIQLNLNRTNVRSGRERLTNVLSSKVCEQIRQFVGRGVSSTYIFRENIENEQFKDGSDTPTLIENEYQFEISRIQNEDIGGVRVYVLMLTNLVGLRHQEEIFNKKLFEFETLNEVAVDACVYCLEDEECTVFSANDKYYRYLGYSQYEYKQIIENKSIRTVYPPDREKVLKERNAELEYQDFDMRFISKDAKLLWAKVTLRATDIVVDGVKVVFCIIRDYTEEKLAQIEYNKQKQFMELVETSIEGGTKICFNDRKKSFAYVGTDLLNFLGYSYDEFMTISGGSLYGLIYKSDAEETMDMINTWFNSGNYYEVEYRLCKSDGSIVWVMDKGNKIIDENGEEVCVGLISDIDNTRKIIGKLEESNKEMKKLQNSIPGSFGKVALFEDEMVVRNGNEQFYELFGEEKNDFAGFSVKYDELGLSKSYINEVAIRRESNIEYVHHRDGSSKWYMIKANYSGDDFARRYPEYYIMVFDITKQEEIKSQANMQREKYKILSDISEDIIFEYDCLTDIMIYSEKYKNTFGNGPVFFSFIKNYVYNEDDIDYKLVFDSVAQMEDRGRYYGEYKVTSGNVENKWFSIIAIGIREGEKLLKIIGALRNIDEAKREHEELVDKSRLDSLTKLCNTAFTREQIEKKLTTLFPGETAALIMADIDDFKDINDMYGHPEGDRVLIELAGIFTEIFTENAVIGRVGGDEFQVFVSGILDRKSLTERLDVLFTKAEEFRSDKYPDLRLSISAGVAYASHMDNYSILYNKADSALYSAKENGKNRYEVYGQISRIGASDQTETYKSKSDNIVLERILELAQGNDPNIKKLELILDYIGYNLSLNAIEVFMNREQSDELVLTARWQEGVTRIGNDIVFEETFIDYTKNEDYAVINSQQGGGSFFAIQFKGISALFQFKIKVSGKLVAAINFTSNDKDRIFGTEDISRLTAVSKLLRLFVIIEDYGNIISGKNVLLAGNILKNSNYVLEVDTFTGEYDMFIINENVRAYTEYMSHGFYDRFIESMISNDVATEYRSFFESRMQLEQIRNYFNEGNDTFSVEYRKGGEMNESYGRIIGTVIEEESKIVMYFCDLDNLRIDQIFSSVSRGETAARQATIQESFDRVLEILADEDYMKELYIKRKSRLENYEYSQWLYDYRNRKLHEDDADLFYDKMSIGTIRKHFLYNSDPLKFYVKIRNDEDNFVWNEIKILREDINDKNDRYIVLFARTGESENIERIIKTDKKPVATLDKSALSDGTIDILTGVYNIQTFYDNTRKMLDEDKDGKYAIIRIDIDKFKLINDLYGFAEGDKVLQFIASVIRSEMQDNGTYGRINSDIFCMCIKYENVSEIVYFVERLVERLDNHHMKLRFVAFFGICIVEDPSVDIGIMCDWANLALRTIKGNRISRYAFYDSRLRKNILDEKKFENEMENALASGQFEAYFQPQYDIGTSKVAAAEALVRWNHPVEGLMSPGRFIPVFERNGFIIKVDEFIWEETCKALRNIIDSGWSPVPISVNVSRMHMYDDKLCDKLLELTNKYSLPHRLLVLEVTETVYFDDALTMNRILAKLRNYGFPIAMDDFGSGFSSLNMLQEMKLDELKIDREFLSKSALTPEGKTIVKYIIGMAKELNLTVVAEGVETAGQAAFLLESDCNIAQGYYYSKPVPLERFLKLTYDPAYQKNIDNMVEAVKKKKEEKK